MKEYRVGLLGYGFIGRVHAYAHANLPFFYNQESFVSRVTHVCTAHESTANRAARMIGEGTIPVTDFRLITENPEIDIVDIATPNDLHAEALLSTMAHGKHLYCDKPLTSTREDALRIRDAWNAGYNAVSQMTLQNRFFPSMIRAKQLIEEGRLGQILEFRGAFLHAGSSDPNAPCTWKVNAGTIADLGSHILDLLQWLIGDSFTEVCASTHTAYADRPAPDGSGRRFPVSAEDNMLVLARLKNGATGTVTASKIATGTEDEISLEIFGSKGAIRLNPMDWHRLNFYDRTADANPCGGLRGWTAIDCGRRYDDPTADFPSPKAPIGWLRSHVHCLYSFLRAVHENKPAHPSLEDGVRLQLLMDAVKDSAQTRRWRVVEP